ncbi:hypothetical protein J1N35_042030 [Gossypium stocksii]|uniref:ELMO domain-containing protein n=1 Tax=Gossypium stocksii TaxID=47602 RepID=A0A9D3ZJU7_9ROSI|nr:hypothetical protein J1N35_042030 [Gossypium stocksii]
MVKKKHFFCNFITIMFFGVVGTLVSCTIISLGISNDLMETIYNNADVLKRSTSICWNNKRQSGFKLMKKKIERATNEIRNVARGGGFISLENLLFFATNFPKSFEDLLWKLEGDRSVWEYPFAVAGVNITFMLIQKLHLEVGLVITQSLKR